MTNIPKDTQDLINESLEIVDKVIDNSIYGENNIKEELTKKLKDKNIEGYKKYGEFKFENNNMYQMAEEEVLDAINYSSYEVIKLKKLSIENKECQIEAVKDIIEDLLIIYEKIQDIRIDTTEKLDKHFNS